MEAINKKIFAIVLFFLLVANASAVDILKPATLNNNYTVIQTCATCTYVNATISNSDGIIVSNAEMTYNGSGNWFYTLNITKASRHDVTGVGDKDGVDDNFVTYFEVSPSGKVVSTGDSILYFLFSGFLIFIITMLLFFIFIIPSNNETDPEGGFETKIIRIKYFRAVLIFLIWPCIILLLNFLNGLATNFSALTMFSGILGFLFTIMMRLSWPFTVIMIAWIIVMLIHDTNLGKQLKKWEKVDLEHPY